jgi:hypothetical protein
MQAFEDLKQDIQNLIDTASDTIKQIVDQAAARAQGSFTAPSPGSDGSEFTSQIEELRTKIRVATDNLKEQARTALDNPSFNFGGGGSSGGVGGATSGQTGGTAPAQEPTPSAGPGLSQTAVDSKNLDDQMPAGGSAQPPNTPVPPGPNFGGSTIGPDSFKSGA